MSFSCPTKRDFKGYPMHFFLLFFLFLSSRFSYAKIEYSFVFQIHEDDDHSFRDLNTGKKKHGDKEAYKQAKALALSCKKCEVFIFRDMRKHTFYSAKVEYFSEGKRKKRIYHKRHKDEKGAVFFQKNSKKYKDHYHNPDAPKDTIKSFFIYFGHHIPEVEQEDYSKSLHHMKFSLDKLKFRLQQLGAGDAGGYLFEGVILSTCQNGTPYTVGKLAKYARYIIASPENLHLSYLDVSPFLALEKAERIKTRALMESIVDQSIATFKKRGIETHTVISLYRMSPLRESLSPLVSVYEERLKKNKKSLPNFHDCSKIKGFESLQTLKEGVYAKEIEPYFSFVKQDAPSSGWGCITLKGNF